MRLNYSAGEGARRVLLRELKRKAKEKLSAATDSRTN